MAILLHIETSTTNCSVAITENDVTMFLKEENNENYSHSEKLHVFIKEGMASIAPKQIDAIVVGKGPGSYTGLRIGVSTAKGLCYALDKSLIALESLEILAQSIAVEEGVIVPMIDARRMEVYAAVFDNQYHQLEATKAEIVTETSFAAYLEKGKVHFIGNGALKCKAVIQHPNAVFYDKVYYPSAQQMHRLGLDKYKKNDIEDVAYFEPYYLKDFVVTKPKK